jgi:hypothetical protein
MKQTYLYLAVLLAGLLLSAGCNHAPRYMSQDHGQSYKAAFSRQVVNPEGPSDPAPAETLPGALGNDIYKKRYIKSMTEERREEGESVSKQLGDLR